MTERDHQASLMRWSRMQETAIPELKMLHANANGAYYGGKKLTGWHMKQQGLKPGIPDLFLAVPRGSYHGLFIELKNDRPRGVVSPEQRAWLASLEQYGYGCVIAYGWEHAVRAIGAYLALDRPEHSATTSAMELLGA